MKKRTLFGILCIVLAAVISCAAIPILLKKSNQRIKIVRVMLDVPKGEIITEDKLEMAEVGAFGLPVNVATAYEQVVGKYAAVTLFAGDYFLPEKISTFSDMPISRSADAEDGTVYVTMAVPSLSASVANTLRTGDIVSICRYQDGEAQISDLLRSVRITALSNADGVNLEKVTKEQSPIAATVTFAVSEEQAKEIVGIDHTSGMHLILVCHGDDERAASLLEEQRNRITGGELS